MAQQIQIASGTMGWFDGIKETISGLALGGGLLIGAGGIAYLTKQVLPKQYQTYGYITSGVLGVLGAYSIWKGFKEPTEEELEPQPDERFPISITDPFPGEEWSRAFPHNINVEVHNPYFVKRKVFVGMSIIQDGTTEWINFPIKILEIPARDIKKTSWWMAGSPTARSGLFYIVVAVWDKKPFPGGDAIRLGEAEGSVIFKWIG